MLKKLCLIIVVTVCCASVAVADHRSHLGFHGHSGFGRSSFGFSSRHNYGGGFYPGWSYGYPYGTGLRSGLSVRLYSGPSYYSPYGLPRYSSNYWGNSFGTTYYYPTQSYVVPSQNYVVAPTTIERSTVIELESSRPPEPTDGGPIAITNSGSEPITYTINGHRFTMKPGQSQKFANDRRWIIEFDQELGRGHTKYTLNSGAFKFKRSESGWDFVQSVERAKSDVAPPPPIDDPSPLLIVPTPM